MRLRDAVSLERLSFTDAFTPMEIADNRIVTIHFVLIDGDGDPITSTYGHDPLIYMHGKGTIVPAMEQALLGKSTGDKFETQVTPETGFGPHHPELVQTLPRSAYDGAAALAVGTKLSGKTSRGQMAVVVTAIDGEQITVDGNHPLAGKTFTARIEVVDVRVPTPQEIQLGLG